MVWCRWRRRFEVRCSLTEVQIGRSKISRGGCWRKTRGARVGWGCVARQMAERDRDVDDRKVNPRRRNRRDEVDGGISWLKREERLEAEYLLVDAGAAGWLLLRCCTD